VFAPEFEIPVPAAIEPLFITVLLAPVIVIPTLRGELLFIAPAEAPPDAPSIVRVIPLLLKTQVVLYVVPAGMTVVETGQLTAIAEA